MWELIILLKIFLHNIDHNLEPIDWENKSKWIDIKIKYINSFFKIFILIEWADWEI